MTRAQVIADLIKSYNETLADDSDDLAHADFDGFCAWAWSDDEPLRTYRITRETYRDCLAEAYNTIVDARAA